MGHSAASQSSGEASPPLEEGGVKVEGEDKGSLSGAGYPNPALLFQDFKHLGLPVFQPG